MRKFAVFSGFLGSGKTTTMMALTRFSTDHFCKAAMISNDLGGAGLADNRFAGLSGCLASELTGDCICYQTQNLVNRLRSLYDQESCSLVISDIPGFGVGALEHVYHTLRRDFPDECSLAPFTVLCEPHTLEILKENRDPDLSYILRSQLLEADLIVLNKCDLLSPEQQALACAYLGSIHPQAQIIAISAQTGEGLEILHQALIYGKASLRSPDLQYGKPAFLSAMGNISEYYLQYHAIVCCNDFSGTDYLLHMVREISNRLSSVSASIPHMKLLAWTPEGDYGKVDYLGADRPPVVAKAFSVPCTELAVILNASAFCPSEILNGILTDSMYASSEAYQLSVTIFRKECFSAMEGSH